MEVLYIYKANVLHLSFEVHYTNLQLLVEISFESVQRLRLGSDKKKVIKVQNPFWSLPVPQGY